MKQQKHLRRLAAALLLTTAALPLSPLAAQDAQQTPVDVTPPPAPAAPTAAPAQTPPVVATPPIEATPAPAPRGAEPPAEAAAPAAEQAPAARQPRTARAAPRPAARAVAQPRAAAPVRQAAPAPALAAPVPAAPPITETAAPPPAAEFPAQAAPAPAPQALPADPAPAAAADEGDSNAPLLLVGALALAGIGAFLFARRRRRRSEEQSFDNYRTYGEPAATPPPVAVAPEPVAAAPVAAAPVTAAAVAPSVIGEAGRPWIELLMRPVRAGVGEQDARVEFELCVDNKGSAPAEDIRISTFMLAAGSRGESEMERSLIEHPPEARLPDSIDPGEGKRIATAVALPREGLADSILPVVVAEVLYRLPDGGEGRTSVSFAVGVPFEGELAHFDVEKPSGLHEGIEARQHREPQRS